LLGGVLVRRNFVMPGLVPGTHDFDGGDKDVDGRDKPGQDA
jgi:hypothetical protein